MYASKIAILKERYKSAIPGARYNELTYVGDHAYITVPADVSGVISVQYTPFQSQGYGVDGPYTQLAAVKVWAEVHDTPVIERQWVALNKQRLVQMKRARRR